MIQMFYSVNSSIQVVTDPLIQNIGWGPTPNVRYWLMYFLNGYKFHTIEWSNSRFTENFGVCVLGTGVGSLETYYYGKIIDINELKYVVLPLKRVVLFKCEWYDPSVRGTKIHDKYGIVEV